MRVGITSPVGELGRVGRHALDRRADPDLDPAPAQLVAREVGQALGDLGHQPVAGLHEHEAHALQPAARIELEHVGREVLQLGQALHPRVAGADEDVGEQRVAGLVVVDRLRVSSVRTSRLRSAIASDSVLKPSACSASPGIGSVREVDPT